MPDNELESFKARIAGRDALLQEIVVDLGKLREVVPEDVAPSMTVLINRVLGGAAAVDSPATAAVAAEDAAPVDPPVEAPTEQQEWQGDHHG